MADNNEIMACLKQISGQLADIGDRLTRVEERLTRVEDRQTKLEDRQTKLEDRQTKLEEHQTKLEDKVDNVEFALDQEINKVYRIALENQRDIREVLIPYNERNVLINEQISKISELEEWKNEAEKVIGDHSEAIRKLQESIA